MKKNATKQFYIDSEDFLQKWMHQNKAVYTGDYLEGCLLDNFVVYTRRGVAAVYEHYLNEWQSNYRIEWQAGKGDDILRHWDAFVEAYTNNSED